MPTWDAEQRASIQAIAAEVRRARLPPSLAANRSALVLALVANAYAESRLRPRARNRTGSEDSVGLFQANRQAVAAYEPPTYDGPVTLFVATQARGPDPQEGWAGLIDALETVPLAGNHYSILQPPLVQRIAERLRGPA